MRPGILRNICIVLLSGCAIGVIAQDDVMKTLKRMITTYPDAHHRIEYRHAPREKGNAMKEIRYDFRIKKEALKEADLKTLLKIYEDAWKSADPQTDRMQKYEYLDSICSTIVYGGTSDNKGNLLSHSYTNDFWGAPGYFLFDAGKDISIAVDRLEHITRPMSKPDFDEITKTVDNLRKTHKFTEKTVRYTGSEGNFIFQRSIGKGWTRGKRYTLEGCSKNDFEQLAKAFKTCFGSSDAVNMISYNDQVMLKNEVGPEFFIASFKDGDKVNFLSATVEDEICIPEGWENIDCYNNGIAHCTDVSRLDSLFDTLSQKASVISTPVQYTGSFSPQIKGFIWQRGWGKGWTRGNRVEIPNLSPEEKIQIMNVFKSYKDILPQVNLMENRAETCEEGTRTFYGFEATPDGKGYFLKVTTEKEICVPVEWKTLDYYKGPGEPMDKSSALAGVSQQMRHLYALSQLWSSVRQNFAFMDRAPVNWDSLYIASMPRMMEAKDDHEATRLLQEITARLKDGHTYVYDSNPGTYPAPLSTKRIGSCVYIDHVYSSALLSDGIHRGMEITHINGIPVDEYVKRFIMPYASSSTPQWTEHICYDGQSLMNLKPGEEVSWTLKDGDRSFDYKYKSGSMKQDIRKAAEPLTFSMLDKKIGYLKIASFADQEVTDRFDSIYPTLFASKALIIDIRGNEGGNSGFANHILRHFATDTLKSSAWESPLYIPAYASWNYPPQKYQAKPSSIWPIKDKKVYDRPVVLLVDNGTFSAAEDFISAFRSIRRGKLIGRPTGGSTGNGVRVVLLPDVAMANICSKHDTAADGTEFVGKGFTPDIPVEETYKSYFKDKRDASLSAAIDLLKKEL